MGTLVLTAEGQAGHTLSVEAPQRGGRRMAEMTFYDPLTPEESAYHFSRSCHLVSVLKTASSEDLIKARVDTPGGGPQASRMEQAGVYVKQSSLKPLRRGEGVRLGSHLSHPVDAPGRVGGQWADPRPDRVKEAAGAVEKSSVFGATRT